MIYVFFLFLLLRCDSTQNWGRGKRLLQEEESTIEYGLGDDYFEDENDSDSFAARKQKYLSQEENDGLDDYQDPEDFVSQDIPSQESASESSDAKGDAEAAGKIAEGAADSKAAENTSKASEAAAEASKAADNANQKEETEAKAVEKKAEAAAKVEEKEAEKLEKEAKKEAEKLEEDAKKDDDDDAAKTDPQKEPGTETEKAKVEAEKAKADVEKAKAEAEKAKADAEKAKAQAADGEKAKADAAIEKAKAETEKAKADAEIAKAEAEKAKADATVAKKDEGAPAAAEAAKAEAAKAIAEGEKAKAEAEKAKAETEKAKAEAAKATKQEGGETKEVEGKPNTVQTQADAAAVQTKADVKDAVEAEEKKMLTDSKSEIDKVKAEAAKEVEKAKEAEKKASKLTEKAKEAEATDSKADQSKADTAGVQTKADVKAVVEAEEKKLLADSKSEIEKVKAEAAKEVEKAKEAEKKASKDAEKAREAEETARKEMDQSNKEKDRLKEQEERAKEKQEEARREEERSKRKTEEAEREAKQAADDAAKEVKRETQRIEKAAKSNAIRNEIRQDVEKETIKQTAKILPVVDRNGEIDRDGAAKEADRARKYRDDTKALLAGRARREERDSKRHADRAEKYADEAKQYMRQAERIARKGGSRRDEDDARRLAKLDARKSVKEANKSDREKADARRDSERAHKAAVVIAKKSQDDYKPEDKSAPPEFFRNRIPSCPVGAFIKSRETCARAKKEFPDLASLRLIDIPDPALPRGCYVSDYGIRKMWFNPTGSRTMYTPKRGAEHHQICRYTQITKPHNHCPRENAGCPPRYFRCVRGPARGGCFPHDIEDDDICSAFSVRPCTRYDAKYRLRPLPAPARREPAPKPPKPQTCNEALAGTRGQDYRGCQDTTRSGYKCQNWNSQTPHKHTRGGSGKQYESRGVGNHNYCRNPDAEERTIWCYVADPPEVRYDYCDPKGSGSPAKVKKKVVPKKKPLKQQKVIQAKINEVVKQETKKLEKAAKAGGPKEVKKVERKLEKEVKKLVKEKEKEAESEDKAEVTQKVEKKYNQKMKKAIKEITKPEPPPPVEVDMDKCDESLRGQRGEAYRGCQSVTVSGRKCQNWMTQTPHAHKHTKQRDGTGNHNFCRNPDGDTTIWCYTTDPMKRMEYCKPRENRCDEGLKEGRGEGYRGCQTKTISGKTCQKWSAQAPHKHDEYTGEEANGDGVGHHNYCRNPGGMKSSIWCYTTDIMKKWEYCAPKSKSSIYDNGRDSYYIKVADQRLYIHAWGGSKQEARETLHYCPKKADHPNCQWTVMPSTTRPNVFYLKVSNKNLFMHALGGAVYGARTQLRECNLEKDMDRCQWEITNSPTRPGMVYIKSAGAELFLMAKKRSKVGAEIILHPCPREDDIPNCQWMIEGYPLPGQISSDKANGKLLEEVNRQRWSRKKAELGKMRAEMRATDAQRTAVLAQNLADEGVMQIQRANLKLEQLQQRLEEAQRRYSEMEEKSKLDRKKNRRKEMEKREALRKKAKKLEKERQKRKSLLKDEKARLKEMERLRKEESQEEKNERKYAIHQIKKLAQQKTERAKKAAKKIAKKIKSQEKKKTKEIKRLEKAKEKLEKQKLKAKYLRKRAKDKRKLLKKEAKLQKKKKAVLKKAEKEKKKMKAMANAKKKELANKIGKIKKKLDAATKKKADALINKAKAKQAKKAAAKAHVAAVQKAGLYGKSKKTHTKTKDHIFSGICSGKDRQEYAGASSLDACAKATSLAEYAFASYSDKEDRCFMFQDCNTENMKETSGFRTMALMWTEAPTGKKLHVSLKDEEKFDEMEDKLFAQWRDSSSDQSSNDEDDDDDDDDDVDLLLY